jgi:hypothetical protein
VCLCHLDRMASWELGAACLRSIVECVASHAEPHIAHEGANDKEDARHGT